MGGLMDAITKKIAEAGLIDKHVLELLQMWGMPVDPTVAKKQVTKKLRAFVSEIEVLLQKDAEEYPPEVRLEEAVEVPNPKTVINVSDIVTTSTRPELKVVYEPSE
jgi:hypothetical protein